VNHDSTRLFRDRLPALLVEVNEHLALDSRFECGAVPCDRLDLSDEYQRRFGDLLAATFEFDLADSLEKEFGWFVSAMCRHGFEPAYFSRMLEAWSLAVVSSLSSGAAAELTVPIDRLRRRLGVLLEGHPMTSRLSEGAAGFLGLLLQRRRRDAAEYLIDRLRGGRALEAVVNDVVLPALTEVGLRWQRAQVTVADEHAATAICQYAVLRLSDSQVRSSSNGKRALVCCAPGEEHELGAELVGEYLDLKGWEVFFVGRSSPQDDTLNAATSFSPDSVFISVTLVANLPAARGLVLALRQALPGAAVVLGGRAAILAQARLEGPGVNVVVRFDEADSR
jgi:methanogenic corrinoid protein MtbC1